MKNHGIYHIGNHTHIYARDLDEAHFLSLSALLKSEAELQFIPTNNDNIKHEYLVSRGSGENDWTRLEFNSYSLEVEFPGTRPLEPQIPVGVVPPTDKEYVRQYFEEKIINNIVAENETYTYGYFIMDRLEAIMDMLIKTPETNHAYIRIGGQCEVMQNDQKVIIDVDKEKDPPCLRHIQWRVFQDRNIVRQDIHVLFRSWDLWAGFPSNLAAIQLLNEYVSYATGYIPGRLFAYSPGLHLYGTAIEQAKIRLNIQ